MQYKAKAKNKTALLLISLLSALVLLVGAFVLVQIWLTPEEEPDGDDGVTEYPVLQGEAEGYLYPIVDITKINYISIENEEGAYEFVRAGDAREFHLRYKNGDGEWALYYPDICFLDEDFSYSSLYATDAFGSGEIARIYYLAIAVGMVGFNERIPLPTVPEGAGEEDAAAILAEREALLAEYGLADTENSFKFNYTDDTGASASHSVTVGGAVVTGAGRYVLVDGRDYIYATSTDTIEYVLRDHMYFIKGTLVAPGLAQDSSYEPYLTTAFRQWRNSKIEASGTPVSKGATVSVSGSLIAPIKAGSETPDEDGDGYSRAELSSTLFDLSSYTGDAYTRLVKLLEGRPIGSYESDPLVFSLLGSGALLDFEAEESYTYSYTVSAVEAVLTSTDEIATSGTRAADVADAEYIKVTYSYKIGGVSQNTHPVHAVIALGSPLLSEEVREALSGAAIGEGCDISFDITYSEENATQDTLQYVLSEILIIETEEGVHETSVGESSIVTYRYYILNNGKRSETYTATVDLSRETEGEGLKVKQKLLGLTVGATDQIVLMQYTEHSELMLDFITYEFDTVAYFLESEMVVSFAFANMAERNPFYGESIYQNLTEGKNGLYGLNEGMCEAAVKLLGGLGENSTASVGLWGDTVALGITPELLDKYGLHAYTVYFELPRGITEIELDGVEDEETDGGIDETSNYFWYSTLGFTLYISEELEDGSRYVASDMYDTIVKIDGEPFAFLKYDFVDFWARRTLLLVDITSIENIKLEMHMQDRKGVYDFALSHAYHPLASGDTYDQLIVHLTPSADYTAEVLEAYLAETGKSTVKLDDFYNDVLGGGESLAVGRDYAGAAYFKELMRMIYFISYTGVCTDEEEASITEHTQPLMRLSVDIPESSLYPYTYEFYRISDRQVLVRLSQTNAEGEYVGEPVQDFYISTGAFKMIVNAYDCLFAAQPVYAEAGYGTENAG